MDRFKSHKSRKKKFTFFSTVVCLCFIILFSNNSFIVGIGENTIGVFTNSLSKFFYGSIANSKEVFKNIFGTKAIREENENLKAENIELKEKLTNMENVISKEDFLKNEYELYKSMSDKLMKSHIVGRDVNSLFVRFSIDRGSKDGVSVGDIVVQGAQGDENKNYIEAVVGKVVEVGYNWSKVSSLVDSTSNISFKVVRTQTYGVISGQENNYLSGFMYKSDAEVEVGDKLVTSGIGGIFPKDLYIGEVVEMKSSVNNLEKLVYVKSPVDFSKLYRVFVLKNSGEHNE
ncbi:MAG: rod shape-determining protein MreC [Peptoniphilaceae bacterium]|uniref:rod shape-determining protein MreC n=1 Tax=Parvimonas sp. TaxID=1944660 RepID=UPI0025F05A27|nr:rod shape-determining protein MreC [Parvimonas sp.]MCI5997759.1 rod shape-determining protein MreC [Parvimonas sp.]MDD7765316.1 rod shape-determining protein MreC [Peptoniphilaceae bacterium]MDY3050928.1 rod shape-determining protein MreC [Parvimonas sp.]